VTRKIFQDYAQSRLVDALINPELFPARLREIFVSVLDPLRGRKKIW
jgi:hypothetical protein